MSIVYEGMVYRTDSDTAALMAVTRSHRGRTLRIPETVQVTVQDVEKQKIEAKRRIGKRKFKKEEHIVSVITDRIETYSVTQLLGDADRQRGCLSGMSALKAVEIPRTVSSISKFAFVDCPALEAIHVHLDNPRYCSRDGVLFSKDMTRLIRYPAAKRGTHYTIPDTVTSIGDLAFQQCRSLRTITIPDSVTYIGDGAFAETQVVHDRIPQQAQQVGQSLTELLPRLEQALSEQNLKEADFLLYDCLLEGLTHGIYDDVLQVSEALHGSYRLFYEFRKEYAILAAKDETLAKLLTNFLLLEDNFDYTVSTLSAAKKDRGLLLETTQDFYRAMSQNLKHVWQHLQTAYAIRNMQVRVPARA